MPGHTLKQTWQHDPIINAPPKYRRACRYDAFVPDTLASLNVRLDASLSGLVSEAERAIRDLNEPREAALDPLARLLLRTESIASSRVEGMQVGARELARAEAKAESGIQTGPTALEILANIDAMILAVDEAATVDRCGEREVLAIHRRLLERTPQQRTAGQFRTRQNWIGGNNHNPCGADFVPPPPEHLARLLEDLHTTINDDTLSPLVQAALVHAQFETIHPFDDGNGRTGRALIHVVFRRRGLAPQFLPPVSVLFARSKDRYIAGLTRFRGDDVEAWIDHFASCTIDAARLASSYVAAVHALRHQWREQLAQSGRSPRGDAAAWAIIDVLPAHPMISAPVAVAVTRRNKARVYEAIDQLTAANVLIPVTSGKRNRWWEASGLLALIEGLESGQPFSK